LFRCTAGKALDRNTVLKKNNKFILNSFKIFLEKNICKFFFKRGKISTIEFSLIKLLKKMKKKTIQKPYFYIWNQMFSFLLVIKLICIRSKSRKHKYYIKNLDINTRLTGSIKMLMLGKKEFKLFYYRLNNINMKLKKKYLTEMEKNKFNIIGISLNIILV